MVLYAAGRKTITNVCFAGYNKSGFSAASPIYTYTIDLSTPSPSPTPVPITACTATLDKNLALHVPYITYIQTAFNTTVSFSADFTYELNLNYPSLIIFKYADLNMITNPSFSCAAATLSSALVLHVPDVLFPDGVTHVWADLTYSTTLSTDGNDYFVVTNYGNL